MEKSNIPSKNFSQNELVEAKCLFELLNAINSKAGVNCWLDQGSLLGIVRDGRFLPIDWDHDFDLGVWWDEYRLKKVEVLRVINSLGWKVCQFADRSLIMRHIADPCRKISIAIYYRDQEGRALKQFVSVQDKKTYLVEKFIAMLAYVVEQIMLRSQYLNSRKGKAKQFLDYGFILLGVFARSKFVYSILVGIAKSIRSNVAKDKECLNVVCDSKFFEKFEESKLLEYSYKIPVASGEYLEFKYGYDWQIPRKEWNYLTEDGGVIK